MSTATTQAPDAATLTGSSLYQRHRPQRFGELVGQDLPARALAATAASDNPGQSFLLTGPRGTGKTTSARILAMALNCPHRQDGEPCTTCDRCTDIREGRSTDVVELDAANNNGVADVRALLERLAIVPAQGGKRVVILDEAHMLSTAAANTLLKPLEEPAEHVVFVLVTTDPQRLPDTVRSRCQQLQFRTVNAQLMRAHLGRVGEVEGLELSDHMVGEAVRRGAGSVRDSLSALEVVIHGDDAPEAEDATDLVASLAGADLGGTLTAIAEAAARGAQFRQLAENAVSMLRDGFLAQMGQASLVTHAADQLRPLAAAGPRITVGAIEAIGDAMTSMRAGHDARVCLEIELARHCTRHTD